METLKLEHLKGYLDCGLKFVSAMDKPYDEMGKNPIWTFDGINKLFGDYCLTTKENNDAYAIQYCKPILHPLSSLIKEIEINGEKFVPIDFIEDKYYTQNWHEQLRQCVNDARWIYHLDYSLILYLFQWKFDVFSLIENNLAIAVTEDFNPYK